MKRKKMTAKQLVLKNHPRAWLWYRDSSDDYVVMPPNAVTVFKALGIGDTPRKAWADAARMLK